MNTTRGTSPGAILIPYGEIADRAEKELTDKYKEQFTYVENK